jgi:hypothetical protein
LARAAAFGLWISISPSLAHHAPARTCVLALVLAPNFNNVSLLFIILLFVIIVIIIKVHQSARQNAATRARAEAAKGENESKNTGPVETSAESASPVSTLFLLSLFIFK